MKKDVSFSSYEIKVLEEWQSQILQGREKNKPLFFTKLFFSQHIGSRSFRIAGKLNLLDYFKMLLQIVRLKLIRKSRLSIFDIATLEYMARYIGKRAMRSLFLNKLKNEGVREDYYLRRLRHMLDLLMPGESMQRIVNLIGPSSMSLRRIDAQMVYELDGKVVATNSPAFIDAFPTSWKLVESLTLDSFGRLFNNNELFINDPGAELSQDFVSGYWQHIVSHPVNSEMATIIRDVAPQMTHESHAVAGVGRCSLNYWHCVMEYIPAIKKAVLETGCKKVIWSRNSPSAATELMRSVLPEVDVIELDEGQQVQITNAVVPIFGASSFDSMKLPENIRCGMDFENILNTYSGFDQTSSEIVSGRRVILLRKDDVSYRKIDNFSNLINDANLLDLEIIDPAQLTLQEQIQIFQTSEEIWSFGGAVWANLVFANKETKFFNLVSRPMSLYLVHRYFATIKDLQMKTFVLGSGAMPRPWMSFRDYMHIDIAYKSGDLQRIRNLSF